MQVFGTVVAVEHDVQVAKNGGGSYPGTRFSYRDSEGALKEKGMHTNTFKFNGALKTQLSNLKAGQEFCMEMVKNGEFWNIVSVLPKEQASQQIATSDSNQGNVYAAKPTTSPKSNYETPEERAKKQVYIIRQSSLTQAVNILSVGAKASPKVEDVINIAKQLEAHVLGEHFDDGSINGLSDDTEGII